MKSMALDINTKSLLMKETDKKFIEMELKVYQLEDSLKSVTHERDSFMDSISKLKTEFK